MRTRMRTQIDFTAPAIISAVVQQRNRDYKFGTHLHSTMEVYEILSGSCKMNMVNQVIECQAGDLLLVMPNTAHSFYLDTSIPCVFSQIHFNPDLFTSVMVSEYGEGHLDLISTLTLKSPFFIKASADSLVSALISSIIEHASTSSPTAHAHTNVNMVSLLLYIVEKGEDISLSVTEQGPKSEYVHSALSYLHTYYTDKVVIDDIAGYLNISSRYLSKVFLEYMGLTIMNYLTNYRISKSIELMMNTDMSLTDISIAIGLKDSQHFSRLFKGIIGLPPYRYRQLNKKGK